MIKNLIYLFALFSILVQLNAESNVYECNKIFEARKEELLLELEKVEEQYQNLDALRSATKSLLDEKEKKIAEQEKEIKNREKEISDKETKISAMLEENKKVLEEIKKLKMDKISTTYSKMKARSAASILSALPPEEAVEILVKIQSKTLAKIFTKMDPAKASELTTLLTQIPKNELEK